MRKIKLFSKSASSEGSNTETMIMETIEKWQKEHPQCRITSHNMAFQTTGSPRLFISVEYDDPEGE